MLVLRAYGTPVALVSIGTAREEKSKSARRRMASLDSVVLTRGARATGWAPTEEQRVDVGSIPQQTPEKAAAIESADLVVGILADFDLAGTAKLCVGLRTLKGSPRIVVLQRDPPGDTSPAANPQISQEHKSVAIV